ncbi:GTPase IMAP family member 9-like [Centroberyx affinis]|uniref:GTPase IMAP family member 9-like n=1 Tax=Centroberyx affinis TaxID=166261 RepID=UPI003A5C0E68
MEKSNELRIVMLGKTGAGKSSSGNTILQEQLFPKAFSPSSVTKECSKHSKETAGRKVSVIDTPGLFDTNLSNKELNNEIARCIFLTSPGPHVFLVVISMTAKFTGDEKQSVEWIQETFGKEAGEYTMVLFTHGDDLDRPVEEYMRENENLFQFVSSCKGGYHVFNNKDKTSLTQVTQLLQKIDALVGRNGGSYYTNDMFRSVAKAYGFEPVMEFMKDLAEALAEGVLSEKAKATFEDMGKGGLKSIAINTVLGAAAVGCSLLLKNRVGLPK